MTKSLYCLKINKFKIILVAREMGNKALEDKLIIFINTKQLKNLIAIFKKMSKNKVKEIEITKEKTKGKKKGNVNKSKINNKSSVEFKAVCIIYGYYDNVKVLDKIDF